MCKISIIIPVFKVEQYLSRCIESILKQTYQHWELLLIDDGSPDKCGQICDEYSQKDRRIRVFHKANGGVSSARNFGLKKVCGEYIMFVDADDWIDDKTLEICMSEINPGNFDIIQFSYTQKECELGRQKMQNTKVYTLADLLKQNQFSGAIWGNVIKSSIITKNNLRFDENLRLGEDQLFLCTCLKFAKKIKLIPNIFYLYYNNSLSATNNEKMDDIIISTLRCIEFKSKYPNFSRRMDTLVLFYVYRLMLNHNFKIAYELFKKNISDENNQLTTPSNFMIIISKYVLFIKIYVKSILKPIIKFRTYAL